MQLPVTDFDKTGAMHISPPFKLQPTTMELWRVEHQLQQIVNRNQVSAAPYHSMSKFSPLFPRARHRHFSRLGWEKKEILVAG
jgi:hypothetical protein